MLIRPVTLTILLGCAGAMACASSGAVPKPFPTPGPGRISTEPPHAEPPPPVTAGGAESAVAGALELRGVPYRNGGSDPDGFDCSGFVWYVFARQGIALPRTVAAQFQIGTPVRPDALQPGDLVFFDTGSRPASHVGMMVGADLFVHAPSSHGVVRTEHLSTVYWSRRFVGARRLSVS